MPAAGNAARACSNMAATASSSGRASRPARASEPKAVPRSTVSA